MTPAPCLESRSNVASRTGQRDTFETWVRRETPRLLATTRRILNHEEDAQDAVQEAFLQAYKSFGYFSGRALFSTWLHRIAINTALMRLRRRQRALECSMEEHDSDSGGGDEVDDAELRRVIAECLAQLPEAARRVIRLRDIEGMDTDQAAREMGIGVDALKMRLHRARHSLRALLEPYVMD